MSGVSFRSNNVMSTELSSKTGNLSQILFRQNERKFKTNKVNTLPTILEKTNPYNWNTQSEPDSEESQRFSIFMDQARMSTYYQDHPWDELQHSFKNGYDGSILGGEIRGNVPPGYLPGNTLPPNKF